MVMPRYQRAGVQIAGMPQVATVGLQEAARTSQGLAQQMDRVSNFAFRQASIQAEAEGREYGALNAPTAQQLQDAIASGQDPASLLPGDTSTTFGRAARGTALDAMALQFETNARNTIVDLQAQFENEQIGLDEFETQLSTLVAQQTDVLRNVSPIAAQKFSASVGVASNAAYLAAAKQQAKRNRTDYEIGLRASVDTILRNAETIVRAGPTVGEDGEVVTVDQKINALRDEIMFAAQEIDDPEFFQSKINELNQAVTDAKVGVVMDEALINPSHAFKVLYGDGQFEDPEVQATFESMSNEERRELFGQVNTALAEADARDNRAQARFDRQRQERSAEIQATFTAAILANDDEAAEAALAELRNVDPNAWESKSAVFASPPGVDDRDTVVYLRRQALNQRLTQADIDRAMSAGQLTMERYKEFMSDLEQQRNQQYNRAIDWLRSNRGVPEGTVINFSVVQQAADREVAQIKSELLDAIIKDPSIDPYKFVQDRVRQLEEEGAGAANAALRQQAERLVEELRVQMPGASAQQILERMQTDPTFYPNEQRRMNAMENLLPIMIDLEARQ